MLRDRRVLRPGGPHRRGRRLGTLVLAVLLLAAGLSGAQLAGSVQPGRHQGQLVSSTSPVSWTPHVLDGYVATTAEVGTTVVLGGNFTQFRAANSSTVITRSHIFSFQRGSGAINAGFAPIVNGEVTSVLPSGDGSSVFVAGGFSQLNGQTVRSLAKIDLATGQRVPGFNPPSFNGRIADMALRNGKLYVSGRFTTVGGQPHTLFAAVDPSTGALDPNVKATFADPRRDGTLSILSSDISPDGSKLVAIGNFTRVNGLDRYQIAVLDLTTSPISVADWSTNRYGDGCSRSFQSYMRDVDISPDGSYFAVVTTGAYASPTSQFLCDTLARWELGPTGSNQQPTWAEYSGGDTLTAVAVTDTAIYAGGHYSYMNNPYIGDSIAAGAAPREALSAHDPRNGTVYSWNPGRTRAYGVYGFLATDEGLWIGSDTDRIAGYQYRGRIAFLPRSGGVTLPRDHTGVLPATVVSLGLQQGGSGAELDRVRTRTFTGDGVAPDTTVTTPGTSAWRDVRGAFMVDGRLYTAWSDATFRVQTYDGTTFGAQSNVPLQLVDGVTASLNRFATEDLSSITGMFYEPVRGRIYFTKSGSDQLFWRGFNTESRVVGAQRFASATGAGGVDWSGVRGMFRVGDQLFTVTTTGDLVRRGWDGLAGLPTGTATTVSGPSIDGQDWRARTVFNYAAADFVAPNTPPVAVIASQCTQATCAFDASASSDADGTVTSYAWDFGDGSSPGAGAVVSHPYAVSGTYTVTLTVTDNRGATATSSTQVEVTVPNAAPVANFGSTCSGLSCNFDGTSSSDADGSVTSYDWDLGDGTSATGATLQHTFAAAGSYTVALTVTDDDGATNTKTAAVSVIDPNQTPSVSFRAVAASNTNTTAARVTVPASVRAGDQLVLFTTVNNLTTVVGGPSGWTLLDSAADTTATLQTFVWTRTAASSDAGSTVTVANSVQSKTAVQLLAYAGAQSVSAHQVRIDTTSTAARTTPVVPVAAAGSTLVSYWADKASDTGAWTLPSGVVPRNQSIGSGSGNITAAVADTGSLGTGPAGGFTAVADSANRRGVVWSVVVAPTSAPANLAPTASFSSSCTALACIFDGGGSVDSDGTITTYAWDLGDGTTATGAVATRTFAAAGTYTVRLTVTDDDGDSASTTRQVSVAPAGAGNVAFRAAAGTNANTSIPTIGVPAAVQPGDLLVLIGAVNNLTTAVTGPAGWTLLGSLSDPTAEVQSFVWTRTAVAGDAGSSVRLANSVQSKSALQLLAYADAAGVTDLQGAADTVSRAQRTTPLVAVTSSGSTVVSYWADKSSATTTWSLPPAVSLRNLSVGSGSGRIVAAVGDTGSLSVGTSGGFTAVADSANRRAVMWSVVVAPD